MKKMTKLISLLALCGVSLVALTACQNNADQSSSDALEQEEFYVYDTNPYTCHPELAKDL